MPLHTADARVDRDGKVAESDDGLTDDERLPDVQASSWTKVSEGGRVVIPVEIRQLLGLEVGSQILLRVEGGELRLLTTRQAVKRAQDLASPFVQPGVSIVDELIADRRAEAARE